MAIGLSKLDDWSKTDQAAGPLWEELKGRGETSMRWKLAVAGLAVCGAIGGRLAWGAFQVERWTQSAKQTWSRVASAAPIIAKDPDLVRAGGGDKPAARAAKPAPPARDAKLPPTATQPDDPGAHPPSPGAMSVRMRLNAEAAANAPRSAASASLAGAIALPWNTIASDKPGGSAPKASSAKRPAAKRGTAVQRPDVTFGLSRKNSISRALNTNTFKKPAFGFTSETRK